MASPTINGTAATGTSSGTTSCTATLTTPGSPDMIIVAVCCEGNASVADTTSVTSPGLTFTKRAALADTTPWNFEGSIWTAPSSGALTAAVITANFSHVSDDAAMVAFGVNGVASTSTPFDPNGALPATEALTSSASGGNVLDNNTATYATTKADDLEFFFGFTGNANSISHITDTLNTGWTTVGSARNTGGANFASAQVFARSRSSALGSGTTPFSTTGAQRFVVISDAMTADSAASTETATVTLAIAELAFNAGAGRVETGNPVSLAIGKLQFNAPAQVQDVTATATLAIANPQIAAFGIDLNAIAKLRQFHTFG